MRFVRAMLALVILLAAGSVMAGAEEQQAAPDSVRVRMITLRDGSTLIGKIVASDDTTITFESSVGRSTIKRDRIREIKEIDESRIKKGGYWFPNPNRNRLYMWPTGRSLRKGQGYFGDIYIFFPSVAYGFTDNFSIEAGLTLFPGVDMDKQLMYAVPKISYELSPGADLSIAAMLFRIPDEFDFDTGHAFMVGLLCGTATLGSEDHSLSLGLGYGYADGEWADKPAVVVGGETRVTRRLVLISENWMSPGIEDVMISYGVRFIGERMAVDLALFNVLDEDAIFPGIPFLGFIWNF